MREGDDRLKPLHTDDLSMNSGKLLREQLAENFKMIEQEDIELRKDMKSNHDDLANKINEINERLNELMNGGGM